jgi:predicted acetyltransferase
MQEKEQIHLSEPTNGLKQAFLEMAADFESAGERYSQYDLARRDFKRYLTKLEDQRLGRDLGPGIVPMDTYWLARSRKTVLGQSHLRRRLTPALKVEGGHIGYAIRPSERRKGYGTLILALTMEKAQAMGLSRVMVTCDRDNIASARIIEKNGGKLTGQSISPRSGKAVLQYWIDL